eukprot:gb/GFBE01080700.1/.p1 GENE.gb/GFBE01080700.1/~~gb/GFBE01080700.1/.p1  ORF type:complete len:230 (+),score=44.30 gb/GFBE01080700.1/:1-690(+)
MDTTWSEDKAELLQEGIDRIFKEEGEASELATLQFSFTMSDPGLDDCPMVGCSSGFVKMTGYQIEEIVGRNCRFLVDPVPHDFVDQNVRRITREYCTSVMMNEPYQVPMSMREPWMPEVHSESGIFCIQTNARKSGELFKNLFHLQKVELDERPYIVGLQTELPAELWDSDADEEEMIASCRSACQTVNTNMVAAEKVMARMFWYSCPMRRQEFACPGDDDDGYTPLAA